MWYIGNIQGASETIGISESQRFIFIFKVKYHPKKTFIFQINLFVL